MIDLHNDALLRLPPRKLLPYLRQAKIDGLNEIWLSVWTTRLKNPMRTIQAKQKILTALNGDPAYPICRLHIEDAWFVTPTNLSELIRLRPHSVGLTWNGANALAGGAHSRHGITKFGYEVIEQLERAGIQIDTAHLNRRSFWQFAKVTTRPLLCTHTAFNRVQRHPRNLTHHQIKAIVQSGGKIGLALVPEFLTKHPTSCGIHDLFKHISYFKRHFDLRFLSLGTDFYGTDHLPYGINHYLDLNQIFHAQIIGYSVLHQPIMAYQCGDPNASCRILITGGMHAREWITTTIVKKLMQKNTLLPNHVAITYVPDCNPDGTRLAQTGLTPFFKSRKKFLLKINYQSPHFHLWKANARGTDLNVNFDAHWGCGKTNLTYPAPANYIGERPHSEPETRAIVKLIHRFRPTVGLAFHSKGEIIYYSRPDDRPTAEKLGQITQYTPQLSIGSYGGLTDYLALQLGIPAFTIEVGADVHRHPLGPQHLPGILPHLSHILDYFFNGA